MITCSPRSSVACVSSINFREKICSCPVSLNSCRMSTSSTAGSGRSITRVSISIRLYRPLSAFAQLSSEGVADPSTTTASLNFPRITATSRP